MELTELTKENFEQIYKDLGRIGYELEKIHETLSNTKHTKEYLSLETDEELNNPSFNRLVAFLTDSVDVVIKDYYPSVISLVCDISIELTLKEIGRL